MSARFSGLSQWISACRSHNFLARRNRRSAGSAGLFAAMVLCGIALPAGAQTKAVTTTALALTSQGSPVTSVSAGTEITLTASVKAGGAALTRGQVAFCDAAAKYCTDIHGLATAQITAAGTAVVHLRPAGGTHSYKAAFQGTRTDQSSASGATTLTVTGSYPSATALSSSGSAGSYTLTATVGGMGPSTTGSPTGSVSFLDTTTGNSILNTVALQPASPGLGWVNVSNPAVGNEPSGIVAGDFNGDGYLDLAIGNNDPNNTVTILLGDGQGHFNPVTSQTITASGSPVLVQDFNGDGNSDLLLTNDLANSFTVLLGNGDGTFTPVPGSPFYTNYGSGPVVTADFNGDGIPDLAFGGGYYLIVELGNGDGTFTPVPTTSSIVVAGSTLPITTGDFNGDGFPDLAIVGASGTSGSVSIWLGKGDGTFTSGVSLGGGKGGETALTTADFNGDGKLDLAVLYNSSVSIFTGNGDGTFQTLPGTPAAVADYSNRMAVADFNGDGIPDLFAGAQSNGPDLTILTGKGDGTFQSNIVATPSLPCCSNTVVGDLNGDGVADLASTDFYSADVQVLLTAQTRSIATLTNPSLIGPGLHQVEAVYPGDTHYGASFSGTVSLAALAATPVISPAQGNYNSSQTVTITETSPGTTIYYSISGAQGNAYNVQYTGPLAINTDGTTTITAYASGTGYLESAQAAASFHLNLPAAPTPSISLASGVYPNAQTVTLSDTMPGVSINYTTNSTNPVTYFAQYTGPIAVASSGTLTATAVAPGYSTSAPASAQYIISSVASAFVYTLAGDGGYGYTGDGGPATLAQLSEPGGVAVDTAGDVYIADSYNNVVRKVAATTGIITTVAGIGAAGNSGDGGPATSTLLSFPAALALDRSGNLFISDTGNNVVRRVDAATGMIATYAGNGMTSGTGDNGPATGASFGSINGLATDAAGNLYVSDARFNVVRKVTASTGTITTVAGGGSPGNTTPGSIGDGGPATSASLNLPEGLAFDIAGNLYIADARDNVIREVNAATQVITTVAGNGFGAGFGAGGYSGDGGAATSAELNFPKAVTLDGNGNLYILDNTNDVIRKVASGTITTYAGTRACSSSGGDGGPATGLALCPNQAMAADSTGHLYVASGLRVREILPPALPPTTPTPTPTFSVSPGNYAEPQTVSVTDAAPRASIYLTVDGTTPTPASQGYLGAMRVDGAATLKAIAVAPGYLPSTLLSGSYTIAATPPAIVTTVAGSGSTSLPVNNVSATSEALGIVTGVATDPAGDIYIPDSQNNVVWKVTAATGNITVAAGTLGSSGFSGNGGPATSALLNDPSWVAVDGAGNLYISDTYNNQVRKVSAQDGTITAFAGLSGFSSVLGDGGPATLASIYSPQGLAFDSAGNLYIADNGDQRIRVVSAATGLITTVAGGGTGPALGDQGPATSAYLANPVVIALDSQGNLYIGDESSNRVREVAAGSGIIRTIAGMGLAGNTGDGGPALQAEIAPAGLAVDPAGNLYISSANTVREIPAGSSTITTMAGTGYYGYSGDGGSALLAGFCGPSGLALDSSGALLVADECNQRIRKITFTSPGAAALPVFSVPGATYNSARTVAITDSTPGATIHYTTDGTTPSTSSPVYSTAITVSKTETLQALAIASGYNNSAVATATYTIEPRTTPTVAVSPSASSVTTAQALTVIVTVSGTAGTPSGTITLSGGGYTSAAAALTGGAASINIPAGSLATGSDTLTATYTPDSSSTSTYNNATGSASVTVTTASKTTPTVTITPSSWNITTAQALTVTVTVSGGSGPTPTGTIALSGSWSGQQTLSAGTATFTIPAGSFSPGAVLLTAAYTPDAVSSNAYTFAYSPTDELGVSLPPGTQTAQLTITPSATTVTDEQSLSVNVSIAAASGGPVPTGSVTLEASNFFATLTLTGGSATFQVPAGTLLPGTVTAAATYSGDTTYAAASGTATINVDIVLAAAATPAPVSPGATTTAGVTLTAGSFAGTMNLSCALTSLPPGAQSVPFCTVNPTTMTLTAGGHGTITATFTTTAASTNAHLDRTRPIFPLLGGGSALFAVVLWCGIPARRRHWRATLLLLITIGAAGLIGCGGGSASQTTTPPPTTPPPTATPATTPGNYVFTVTGTAQGNFRLTASTTITLTVQ